MNDDYHSDKESVEEDVVKSISLEISSNGDISLYATGSELRRNSCICYWKKVVTKVVTNLSSSSTKVLVSKQGE